MIKLTSSLVNQTNVLQQILPNQDYIHHFVEGAFEKSYTFGRGWIITQVRNMFSEKIEILFREYRLLNFNHHVVNLNVVFR